MQSRNESRKPLLGVVEIAKILPHRYPFLLVDRINELDLEGGVIVGQKNVTINEQFFIGHFPGAPIMPGVLIIEALAQTGGVLIHKKGYNEKIAVLMNINNAKFRNPVLPGDTLDLYIEGIHFGSRGGRVNAKAMVGEKVAVTAEIGFGMLDMEQIS